MDIDDLEAKDFEENQVFSFGLEPDRIDILNFSKGGLPRIDDLIFKIIDIRDLLANKENLARSGVKHFVDQQDILALKEILKSRERTRKFTSPVR